MPTDQPIIAVIEDEPGMRKALRRLLACRGFHTEEYGCGEEFLASLRSHPLGCVLLDLQMPGLSGFEVLDALKSRQIAVPVIVITAHDEPGTYERVRALGASAYLKKPVDRDVLFAAIAEIMASNQDK